MELNDTKQQKIHVKIGNYRIQLNVSGEQEEEIFRKAEKQVNKYIAILLSIIKFIPISRTKKSLR